MLWVVVALSAALAAGYGAARVTDAWAAALAAAIIAGVGVFAALRPVCDRWRVLLWTLTSATVFWLIVNPPWKIAAAHYAAGEWAFLFVFSMLSVLGPFSLYFLGLQHLEPEHWSVPNDATLAQRDNDVMDRARRELHMIPAPGGATYLTVPRRPASP